MFSLQLRFALLIIWSACSLKKYPSLPQGISFRNCPSIWLSLQYVSATTLLIVSNVTLADSISLVSHLDSTIQACTPLSSSCHQERVLHVVWLPSIGKWVVLLCIAIVLVLSSWWNIFIYHQQQFRAWLLCSSRCKGHICKWRCFQINVAFGVLLRHAHISFWL